MNTKLAKKKWICENCGRIVVKPLSAANPFDADEKISGCPFCKSVDTLVQACDTPRCNKRAVIGCPTDEDYRWSCGKHFDKAKEK